MVVNMLLGTLLGGGGGGCLRIIGSRSQRVLFLLRAQLVVRHLVRPARAFSSSSRKKQLSSSLSSSSSERSRRMSVDSLSRGEAEAELGFLALELKRHDELYYAAAAPEIDDASFDMLARREAAIEGRFPELSRQDARSKRVGTTTLARWAQPATHLRPMLSLDNALNAEELGKFVTKLARLLDSSRGMPRFACEPKVDGLSLSLRYEDGKLIRAATRGDGTVGEDVSESEHG
jgi:hypothetical protein